MIYNPLNISFAFDSYSIPVFIVYYYMLLIGLFSSYIFLLYVNNKSVMNDHILLANGGSIFDISSFPTWLIYPFRKITSSYEISNYHGIDPTILLAISFSLLFGVMFADVGHGLILMEVGLLTLFLCGKFNGILSYVTDNGGVLFLCGLTSTIAGIFFGEFYGYHVNLLPYKIHIPIVGVELPLSPLENLMAMLKLCIFLSALHLSSGMIIDFINKIKHGEYLKAFAFSICRLWFYLSFILSIFINGLDIYAWIYNPLTTYGIMIPLMLMCIAGMFAGDPVDSFIYTFETAISSLSNTVSYLRLLALALVHSLLSKIFISISNGNSFTLIIGIMTGTIAILILEGIVVFIHTVRLMWVEWFSKFME